MMSNQNRELTSKEKRSIKKLVTRFCANYDSEYGCLPLDCDCPMFGICYTNSAMCRYFRESVLPNDPELQASLESQPVRTCQYCGQKGSGCTAPSSVRSLPAVSRMQREYGNSETSESNHLPLRTPDGTRVFGGHFAFGREFYQNHENSEEKRYTAGIQS